MMFARPIGCLALWTAACLRLTGAEAVPDYPADGPSYHVPFAAPVDFRHLESLRVLATLNGGPPLSFQVDTGSTGMVVSADDVPHLDPNAPPGMIRYSSSGVELHGVWTTVTVTFPGSQDSQGRVATAVLPVLAVKERRVTGEAVNAALHQPSLHPQAHMLGVGFGRGVAGEPHKNPFVTLREMEAGVMRRGDLITRTGFELGLTAQNVGAGYVFQKLVERPVAAETHRLAPALRDWVTTPGLTTVDSLDSPLGTVLIDTGLTNMMIANPRVPAGTDVPPGTRVTVRLLSGKLQYSFTVGDRNNPLTPRRVTWIKATRGASVNTGLRALAGFDYLYDADGGYLGLRPIAP